MERYDNVQIQATLRFCTKPKKDKTGKGYVYMYLEETNFEGGPVIHRVMSYDPEKHAVGKREPYVVNLSGDDIFAIEARDGRKI